MNKIIKRIVLPAFLCLFFIALSACKVNNGDIGALYGTWNIERITVDGELYEDWRNDNSPWTTVEFQNNICMFKRAVEPNDYIVRVATWEWENGTAIENSVLRIDFEHHDDANPTGTGKYEPPVWLLLDGNLHPEFIVEWSDNDRAMTWSTVNSRGQKLVFYLRQTW